MNPVKQIIVVRKDLMTRDENPMGPGKLAAQVAHASMAPLLEKMRDSPYEDFIPPEGNYSISLDLYKGEDIREWLEKDFRKIVLYVKSEEKLLSVYQSIKDTGFIVSLIKDNGLTVFNEPTITCFGVEPLRADIIDPFVKRLRVL